VSKLRELWRPLAISALVVVAWMTTGLALGLDWDTAQLVLVLLAGALAIVLLERSRRKRKGK
jgi:hypothetical protein